MVHEGLPDCLHDVLTVVRERKAVIVLRGDMDHELVILLRDRHRDHVLDQNAAFLGHAAAEWKQAPKTGQEASAAGLLLGDDEVVDGLVGHHEVSLLLQPVLVSLLGDLGRAQQELYDT